MVSYCSRAAVWLLVASFVCAPHGAEAQPAGVQFRETFSTSAELKAGTAQKTLDEGGELASFSISGGEKSQCNAGSNRASKATVAAKAALIERASNVLSFELNASARANGGHWRTCSLCAANQCIGIHGNDSEALATSRSSGAITITLPSSSADARFTVRVISSGEAAKQLEYVLSDPEVGAVLTQQSPTNEATVAGGSKRELQFSANLRASAEDGGGCCSAEADELAQVKLIVERSTDSVVSEPEVVVANAQEDPVPRIAGGQVETGYDPVGALLFDGTGGELCTATVVARRTLITAAHCVNGKATDLLTFVVGATIKAKPDRVFKVEGVEVPDGAASGYNYDSLIYADDIALVYVDRDLAIPVEIEEEIAPGKMVKKTVIKPLAPVTLHAGVPQLKDLSEDGHRLLFIGFGYADTAGGQGRGVKRRVEMQIAAMGSTTFKNESPGQNTCVGDSGGPVLLVQNQGMLQLVGIVSTGDAHCKDYGINTRVDTFAPWLRGKLKN